MKTLEKKKVYEEHKQKMLTIRKTLAESKISLAEAALAEVQELGRFTKALRNAV